jgi:hypothetical protein
MCDADESDKLHPMYEKLDMDWDEFKRLYPDPDLSGICSSSGTDENGNYYDIVHWVIWRDYKESPTALGAIAIVASVAVVGTQLFWFKQSGNNLHLAMLTSAILLILAYVLVLAKVTDASFLLSAASWIIVIVPSRLFTMWLRSMTSRLQNRYIRYFIKFVWVLRVSFTIAKLIESIYYIVFTNIEWKKAKELNPMLRAPLIVDSIGSYLQSSLCAWIFFELRYIVDPELLIKRRQLIRIILIYLIMFISFAVSAGGVTKSPSAFSGEASEYVNLIAFIACYILTLVPRNAINDFNKAPKQTKNPIVKAKRALKLFNAVLDLAEVSEVE